MRVGERRIETSIPTTQREGASVTAQVDGRSKRQLVYEVTHVSNELKIIKAPKMRRGGEAE